MVVRVIPVPGAVLKCIHATAGFRLLPVPATEGSLAIA